MLQHLRTDDQIENTCDPSQSAVGVNEARISKSIPLFAVIDGTSIDICSDYLTTEDRHGKCQRAIAATDVEHAGAINEPFQDDLRKDDELLPAAWKSVVAGLTPKLARQQANSSLLLGGP
jgi:hypothetical protein